MKDDLDAILSFINEIVKEKRRDPRSGLYSGFDKNYTRREEARWLEETLRETRKGNVISVVAEIDSKIIANGEVTRGSYEDTRHHGHLGLTMLSGYRGQGIGRKMIEVLVRESRRKGLRTLDAEFLATNESARRAYAKAGFKKVGLIPGKVLRSGKYLDGLIMARKV